MDDVKIFSSSESLIIYIGIFFLVAFLIHMGSKKISKMKIFSLLGLVIIITFSSLRYSVGTDYFNYKNIFNRLGQTTFKEHLENEGLREFGTFLINKISFLFGEYRVFLFITSLIIIVLVYIAIKEHEKTNVIFFSMFLFLLIYLPVSFNIIKQFMAIAIVLVAYKYIFEKNFKIYLLLIIIAFFIHSTAIIMLPIYFLWEKNSDQLIDKKKLLIFFLIFTIMILNYELLIELLGNDKYESYLEVTKLGSNRDIFIKFLLCVVIFPLRKKLIEVDKKNSLYIVLIFISLIIGFTGFKSPFIKRIGYYFEIVQIFIIPSILKIKYSKEVKRIIGYVMALYPIVFFILVYYLIGSAHIIPYKILI